MRAGMRVLTVSPALAATPWCTGLPAGHRGHASGGGPMTALPRRRASSRRGRSRGSRARRGAWPAPRRPRPARRVPCGRGRRKRLQRRVGDLQLRGGELEPEGRLVGPDEVGSSSAMGQRYSGSKRDPTVVIAVCLAVHRARPGRLERQLASLHAQRGAEWTLVREDDERGSGAWRAFERCYARVAPEAAHVAPCDQGPTSGIRPSSRRCRAR